MADGSAFKYKVAPEARTGRWASKAIYQTRLGAMYCGESEKVLESARFKAMRGKAQLVFTSPPFPLITEKSYGNHRGEQYIEWLASFAKPLRRMVKPNGSIVLEIGNVWEPGKPVMSTVVLRALLKFLEEGGLHLCQEFVWYNSAKLPSPAQWVNVTRSRVKDAFSRVWWMSPSETPKADNRRVLRPYSPSMKRLIKTGRYNGGGRPSHHQIGEQSFKRDNGGAIPPNVIGADDVESLHSLLKASNTRSTEQYQLFCRKNELPTHPARMPTELAEFFVKFLTDEDDLVIDPFAGSNTTGAAAESLGRRWASIEANWMFAAPSISRFAPIAIKTASERVAVKTAKVRRRRLSHPG